MSSDPARCVMHPARRAVDRCPVCRRPRCAADVVGGETAGCATCRPTRARAAAPGREVLVRSGLAGTAVALVGGFVATQYVGTHYFSVVAPALVGLAASWAVTAAGGRGAPDRRLPRLAVAVSAALLGTALGFRLVPGGQGLLTPLHDVGPPYAAAAAGALVWPVLFGTPQPGTRRRGFGRSRPSRQPGRGSDA